MLRKLYYLLTPAQRLLVRRIVFFPADLWDFLRGKNKELVPPRSMIYTGTGNFLKAGELYLSYFIQYGDLKPQHRVLDVGCGIGRMALPLTRFLDATGSYEGFDIVETGIKWCRENITARYSNFRFQLVSLQNDLYSSSGDKAAEFTFPYKNQEFDFVFLTSVFTHMVPEEVENYMKEIERVLKPGGRCFATFFVFGKQTPPITHKRYFTFPVDHGHYKLMDPRVKSANVAFDFDYLSRKLAKENQLNIIDFIPGYWRDMERKDERDFQDIVIFKKRD